MWCLTITKTSSNFNKIKTHGSIYVVRLKIIKKQGVHNTVSILAGKQKSQFYAYVALRLSEIYNGDVLYSGEATFQI